MKNNKQEKLVPELRFKEFRDVWVKKSFGELFTFHRNNSFSRNDLSENNGNVFNIHYGDIHTKFPTLLDVSKVEIPTINNDIEIKTSEDEYVKNGDLILADASEDYLDIGKAIELIDVDNKKILSGLHTILARPKDKSEGFYGNLFQTFKVRYQIMRLANGISVLGISKKNLKDIQLTVPSISEQQKISSFLSLVDKRIEQLNRKKELLELYKKGVMQKIFNREIRFKDDNGNDYPEWEEKKLGEMVSKCKDKNKDFACSEVLTNSAFKGIVSQRDYFDRSIVTSSNLGNYYVVETGDFVYNPRISSLAPVGPISRNNLRRGIMSPLYTIFRPQDEYSDFLEVFFDTSEWHKYMKKVANYGARFDRMNIVQDDFYKLPIRIPVKEERELLLTLIKDVYKISRSINVLSNKMIVFKKGLLQKMFI